MEDILFERDSGAGTLPLKAGLRILESLYGTGSALRNFMYDKNVLKAKSIPCRVVCIGNLTVGGTGKTPVVIMTARMLREAGCPVAVVSRGYRGTGKGPLVVSDGSDVCVSPVESGDEPHIIARELPGVPVVVGKNRYEAARLACERFHPWVVVLDDAFQHRKLARNVDIVTIDCDNPYGNEHLLPRGVLRESPYSLRRAGAVVVTRCRGDVDRKRLERMIRYYDRRVRIFWSGHFPVGLRRPGGTERSAPETLKGRKVAALSNIAVPGSFHRMLEDCGADLVHRRVFPDHHRYSGGELEAVEREAREAGADLLVMTAKDERNLPGGYDVGTMDKLVLDIETRLLGDHDEYLNLIKPALM